MLRTGECNEGHKWGSLYYSQKHSVSLKLSPINVF
jgi:hypothetical protein